MTIRRLTPAEAFWLHLGFAPAPAQTPADIPGTYMTCNLLQ